MNEPEFIKCPNCGYGQFLKDQAEAKCIGCGNIIKRQEKIIRQPDLVSEEAKITWQTDLGGTDNINAKNKKNDNTIVKICVTIIVIGLVVVFINNRSSNDSDNRAEHSTETGATQRIESPKNISPIESSPVYSPDKDENKNDYTPDNLEAYTISKNFVKDNIVSPSTADFPWEPTNVKFIGNKYMVVSYVDAQNSYGAKIRERYMSYQIYNGGGWSSKSNWTLMSLVIGDDIAYINKNKTEQEIADDIDYLRTH